VSIPTEIHHLIIFHCQIVTLLAFLVSNLHEETIAQSLSNGEVSLLLIGDGYQFDFGTLHRPLELLADVVSLRKCPGGQIMVPSPRLVILICNEITSNYENPNI